MPASLVEYQAAAAGARAIVMDISQSPRLHPVDREFDKLGYDIESHIPGSGQLRFIEVKGRISERRRLLSPRMKFSIHSTSPTTSSLPSVEFLTPTAIVFIICDALSERA